LSIALIIQTFDPGFPSRRLWSLSNIKSFLASFFFYNLSSILTCKSW